MNVYLVIKKSTHALPSRRMHTRNMLEAHTSETHVRQRRHHQSERLTAMRFFALPLPVVLHIASAGVYAVVGAFQFAPRFRRGSPGWHRAAGRFVVLCGLLVGLSGLWMTLFYPWPAGDGALLYALRLVFGSAMVASIVLGFITIRREDVMRHRVWMLRGYAIGLGGHAGADPGGRGIDRWPAE
jgi:hypothetical protein